jgi:hypothetical protein
MINIHSRYYRLDRLLYIKVSNRFFHQISVYLNSQLSRKLESQLMNEDLM